MDVLDFLCRAFNRVGITKNHWPKCMLEYGNMQLYKQKQGYTFDINNPRTFTEKVQWYKTRFIRPDLVRYVDKYLFKELIAEKLGGGKTIPMYASWTTVKDMRNSWASLPEKFCLKSNLQSDGNFIKIIEKSKTNLNDLCKETEEWLKPKNLLIHSFCTAYYKAVPRIIAEEYMANFEDQLYDYKFFCFDGKPFCVYVAQDHFGKDGSHISFYDMEWKKMDVKYGKHIVGNAPKPKHFDEMVEIAKKLSEGFPFIRVDFFDTDEKLFMAELTFYPGGGFAPYHPVSFNEEMGKIFDLTKC